MPIIVSCPQCGKKLSAPDDKNGKLARCPGCRAQFMIANTVKPSSSSLPPRPSRPRERDWRLQTPDGQSYGPVKKQELDQWVAEGSVAPDSKLWQVGDAQHRYASEVYPQLATTEDETTTDQVSEPASGAVNFDAADQRQANGVASMQSPRRHKPFKGNAFISTEPIPESELDPESVASGKKTILWTSIVTGISAIFLLIVMPALFLAVPKSANDPPFLSIIAFGLAGVQAVWATSLSVKPIWQFGKKLLNRMTGVIPEGLGCFVIVSPAVFLMILACCFFYIPVYAASFYANFGGGIYEFLRNWELSVGRRVLVYGKPFRFWQCLLAQLGLNLVFLILLLISLIGHSPNKMRNRVKCDRESHAGTARFLPTEQNVLCS